LCQFRPAVSLSDRRCCDIAEGEKADGRGSNMHPEEEERQSDTQHIWRRPGKLVRFVIPNETAESRLDEPVERGQAKAGEVNGKDRDDQEAIEDQGMRTSKQEIKR
jgi:hypothetical protein